MLNTESCLIRNFSISIKIPSNIFFSSTQFKLFIIHQKVIGGRLSRLRKLEIWGLCPEQVCSGVSTLCGGFVCKFIATNLVLNFK